MRMMKRNWVVVQLNNGHVKIWSDYGQAWGSPAYEVLGYFEGTYAEARQAASCMGERVPTGF